MRIKNPLDGEVIVEDLVRGRMVFATAQLVDLIIARSDGSQNYYFAVVVDDSDMQIALVVRGDEPLNNTPRQLNIFSALGVESPRQAHLSMILGADGTKFSHRHGVIDTGDYRSAGYLCEAVLNCLVRLGCSNVDQEIITLIDMVEINQFASTFNPEKLRRLNRQHIT